jgi:ankyrin repeat protein
LIRLGLEVVTQQPNLYEGGKPTRYESRLREAERGAKAAQRGLRKARADAAALHAAIDQRGSESLRALLDAGAPIDFRDPEGRTPLIHAAESGAAEIVEVLLERGAALEARDSRHSRTALIAAAAAGQADAVRILLERGADNGRKDVNSKTALDYAQDPVVRTLLNSAASGS